METPTAKVYAAMITMKSGAVIVVDVTSLKTKHNGLGKLVGVEWTCPADTDTTTYRQLQYVDIDSIAAIVSK